MPTRANVGRKSSIEVLTGKPEPIADIVAFGSPCTVYASPKKALDRRGTPGIKVGKNEETKGYKVIVVKHQTIITTRHVGNIETLSTEANEQLKNVLEREADDELEAHADKRQAECGATELDARDVVKNKAVKLETTKLKEKKDEMKSAPGGAPRRSGRSRKKSQRQREADADDVGDEVQKLSRPRGQAGSPVVMSTFNRMLAMTAIGAGDEQYRHLPDPKSYRAAMQMPDAHLRQLAFDEVERLVGEQRDVGACNHSRGYKCFVLKKRLQEEDWR
ncbi:hypothetical protein PHMEG_0009978 [Phytophthora megakarya]|uniref:Retroviral polymerase SH3-like domain-containing protein n=1 Tax=Phytophthora megakarya TaxID=4795 RepID=A0A225WEU5_9STRA|nr:hypothetical protein PHMEG_0009978 [Phytophthora megakarya]